MATTRTSSEKRGEVLAMLRELLAEGRTDDVLAVVSQLVARNSELERRLAQVLSPSRKNEGVPTAQLQLILDKIEVEAGSDENGLDPAIAAANEKLRETSGIDKTDERTEDKETGKRKRQPLLRRTIPVSLPRVDNPIKVPDAERACPACGAARVCIGHDVTEVVELVPAKLVVRRDSREKLACESCDGEIVRAPPGDKVVAGGRLGSTLVGILLVDKYEDGLPLHRQKQRFERMGLSLPISTLADQVTWATDLLRPLWRLATAPGAGLSCTTLSPGGTRRGGLTTVVLPLVPGRQTVQAARPARIAAIDINHTGPSRVRI